MLKVSALFCIAIIVLLVIGENILPLYGGDLTLAARGSKASFALLGGWAFAFAQPAIWTRFARVLQGVIPTSVEESFVANLVHHPEFVPRVRRVTVVFCWLAVLASAFLAFQLWHGRA